MTTLDDEAIHEAACRAGAVVMGSSDDLADLHYMMNGDQLRRFVALAIALGSPCPKTTLAAPLALGERLPFASGLANVDFLHKR